MEFYLSINGQKTPILIYKAKNIFEKLRGLSNRTMNLNNEGLLLTWSKEIQMRTCKIPLDIVFVNRKGVVKTLYSNVQPRSKSRFSLTGAHCFELPIGTIDFFGIKKGDILSLK